MHPKRVGGKFVLLHRPQQWAGAGYSCGQPSMWINFSNDMLEWDWSKSKLLAKPEFW